MRAGWLWLLAVAGPVAGGLVTSTLESDAWIAVTWAVWIAGPIAAFLATWALLRRLHWLLRVLASILVSGVWSIVAILLWAVGVALGGAADV